MSIINTEELKKYRWDEISFDKFAVLQVPLLRQVYPKLIAEQLVSVQPMEIPKVELKIVKTKLVERERKIKDGWRIEWGDNGEFQMWYDEPEEPWLDDKDFLI